MQPGPRPQQFDTFGETVLPEGPGDMPDGAIGQDDALTCRGWTARA
jgi:hypothetical protein